jgi:hypothetical protein
MLFLVDRESGEMKATSSDEISDLLANDEKENGIKPLCREYSAGPGGEGWEKLIEPENVEDQWWDRFEPPTSGFVRVPPNLLATGIGDLKGRNILSIKGRGSYGMGGPGWLSLDLEDNISLLFWQWGAQQWIKFQDPLDPDEYEHEVRWQIEEVQLDDRKFSVEYWDHATGKKGLILADGTYYGKRNPPPSPPKKGHAKDAAPYKMGELWHVIRSDSSCWC